MLADSREGLIDGAGHLLQALWQERPSLATEFVTKKHLPPLLKQLANFPNLPDGQVYIGMVQDIWSLTPALNAEPLLLETLDRLVEACSVLYTLAQAQAGDDEKQLMRDAQVCYWVCLAACEFCAECMCRLDCTRNTPSHVTYRFHACMRIRTLREYKASFVRMQKTHTEQQGRCKHQPIVAMLSSECNN